MTPPSSDPKPEPAAPLAAAPLAAAPLAAAPRTLLRRAARAVRITVALALILLSLWSVLLPVSLPISTVAAVTARLAVVSTPIRGEMVALSRDTGDRVGLGDMLADVSNRRSLADARVVELEAERAGLQARLAARLDEVKETTGLLEGYQARAQEYATRLIHETEALLVESEHARDGLVAAVAVAESELIVLEARARVVRKGTPASVGGREAEADPASASLALADLTTARRKVTGERTALATEIARVDRRRAHVQNAKDGVYVALGTQALRYPSLIGETAARLGKLGVEVRHARRLIENLDEELRGAIMRLNATAERRIASPVSGVVWVRPVNVGQFVESGAELYQIADAHTLRVQAYLHRRYLDDVVIGDKARVYLVAARRVVSGTIKVIQAIDSGTGKERYAVDLPSPDEDHFQVMIELEPEARKIAAIGGVAKVAVVGQLDGWFERAVMWLYLRFES